MFKLLSILVLAGTARAVPQAAATAPAVDSGTASPKDPAPISHRALQGYLDHGHGVTSGDYDCTDPGNDAITACNFRIPNDRLWKLETTLQDGSVATAYGDGAHTTHIDMDIYVGDLLNVSSHGDLAAAFELRASECFNVRCEMTTRSTVIQPFVVAWEETTAVMRRLPPITPEHLKAKFLVGATECFAEMYYYITGTFAKVVLAQGDWLPAGKDLITRISCPNLAKHLVALLLSSTVYTTGSEDALFLSPCQEHHSVYSVDYSADFGFFEMIQDGIGFGGEIFQDFIVATVIRDDLSLTATDVSTSTGSETRCHPEVAALSSLYSASNSSSGRRAQEPPAQAAVDVGRVVTEYRKSHTAASSDVSEPEPEPEPDPTPFVEPAATTEHNTTSTTTASSGTDVVFGSSAEPATTNDPNTVLVVVCSVGLGAVVVILGVALKHIAPKRPREQLRRENPPPAPCGV